MGSKEIKFIMLFLIRKSHISALIALQFKLNILKLKDLRLKLVFFSLILFDSNSQYYPYVVFASYFG